MPSRWRTTLVFAVAVVQLVCRVTTAAAPQPLPVVNDLQLPQLWGKYYEVGTYLQWIESGCTNSVVTFAAHHRRQTTHLSIECDRGWWHPSISGTMTPIDPSVLARTEATLHPPMGDPIREEFDIILVGATDSNAEPSPYPWLVIGHPKRHLLWILSRQAAMPTAQLSQILERLDADFGYINVRKNLSCTEHRGVAPELCRDALQPRAWFDDLIRYN